jgi:predicted ArsR family transcriptional regulator
MEYAFVMDSAAQTDEHSIGDAQRRIVDLLKRHSPSSVSQIANGLAVTTAAIRHQIGDLEAMGFISEQTGRASGRGRPARTWSLTPLAIDLFPDRHSDLTLELLTAAREVFGEEGVERLITARDAQALGTINAQLAADADTRSRVETLAEHRTSQGYMAEVRSDGDDLLLIEHHCPVCVAATSCHGICSGELQLFQNVVGETATVERSEHLLSGGERCVYRIRTS